MVASVEPRSGLNHTWDLGEDNWNTGMDENLLSLGRFAYHLSVKDKDLATPPVSPADGDSYIVAATATGDWVGQENNIAVWDNANTAWVFGTPRKGWMAYVEDETNPYIFDTTWVIQSATGTTPDNLTEYDESGSYTVQFFDAATGGNVSSTTMTGYYTIIGEFCFVSFQNVSAISTAGMTGTNLFYITMPFAAAGSRGLYCGSCSVGLINFDIGTTQISPILSQGASRLFMSTNGDNIGAGNILVQNINNGISSIQRFSISYRI